MKAILLISILFPIYLLGQECTPSEKPFQSGESVTYKIYYHWGFIWVEAGEVTFSVQTDSYENQPVYNFKGIGKTYSKYNWFYEVNDRYETWSDTTSLKPKRFLRDVNEGDTHFYKEYIFSEQNTAEYFESKDLKSSSTIYTQDCSLDALSMIYNARSINFDNYTVNDKIPLSIVLDGKVHETYIRYLGKEEVNLKEIGKVNAIKFAPLLIEGTIFNGGEGMTVWVSDDKNKVPLQIETEILVGSINAVMIRSDGLKNKSNYLVEKKK